MNNNGYQLHDCPNLTTTKWYAIAVMFNAVSVLFNAQNSHAFNNISITIVQKNSPCAVLFLL